MAEEKVIKFDKGFEASKKDDVVTLAYNDKDVFVDNSPLTKQQMKEFAVYQNQYSKSFLNVSIEEAKKEFKKDNEVKTVQSSAPFGVNQSDKIETMIRRDVTQTIVDFKGEEAPKKITTCSVFVKTKQGSDLSKTHIKDVKNQLHKDLYGDK